MNEWLLAFLFFLPAGAANTSPVFANKLPLLKRWKTPIDFGLNWHGKRLLGDNKRWRGLIFGSFIGGVTGGLVHLLQPEVIQQIRVVSFVPLLDMIFLGMALGFGALAGDAVESFFKRRTGVKPGHSWFPFDQLDFIAGGLAFSMLLADLSSGLILRVIIIYFGLHLVTSCFGYLLGLKDKPI